MRSWKQARQCNLDKDVTLPEVRPPKLDLEGRDSVGGCGVPPAEWKSRAAAACGLHTIANQPTVEEADCHRWLSIAALSSVRKRAIAACPGLNRPKALGRTIDAIYRGNERRVLVDVELNQTITGPAARGGLDGARVTRQRWPVIFKGSLCVGSRLLERFGYERPSPWLSLLLVLRLCFEAWNPLKLEHVVRLPALLPRADLRRHGMESCCGLLCAWRNTVIPGRGR